MCKLIEEASAGSRGGNMHNEFTSLIEKHGEWYVGFCPEVPEANGQGRTIEECRDNLAEAIALVLLDKREDALRDAPKTVIRGIVTVAA
jgi:predicted RNase H-like HicB family nuclease